MYFWEFVLLVYKGLMTGALCIIGNTTIFQPMAATIFQVTYLMAVLKAGPYRLFDLDVSSTVSSLVLFLAALCSIVLFSKGRDSRFDETHAADKTQAADLETIGTFLIVITLANLAIETLIIMVKLKLLEKCHHRIRKQPLKDTTGGVKVAKQTKSPSATKVEPVEPVQPVAPAPEDLPVETEKGKPPAESSSWEFDRPEVESMGSKLFVTASTSARHNKAEITHKELAKHGLRRQGTAVHL